MALLAAVEAPNQAPVNYIPIGLPTLAKWAFDGSDLTSVWNSLVQQVTSNPRDAAGLLDLSTIAHLQGRPDHRVALQSEALKVRRVFQQPAAGPQAALRVLAFLAPGSFMANLPVEFLLEGSDISLDMVYVVLGDPMTEELPDHDVALVAVAETKENQDVLRAIDRLTQRWSRPVVNAAALIARLTRDGTWDLLKSIPGVTMPINARVSREQFDGLRDGHRAICDVLTGSGFPIIARPCDSHAGDGLVKLDEVSEIAGYLCERSEPEFYLAPFVDYRSEDGMFRKYRIALIDGRPFACHMAISDHWMVHYLNAGMLESAAKRAEEARFMSEFDIEFGARHEKALAAIADAVGLDYLPIDCGETSDGRLLVFESGTNMIVHSMDSPDLFPYKHVQMNKVFGAFRAMLKSKARIEAHRIHAVRTPPEL